jgi:kinesin family protein 5
VYLEGVTWVQVTNPQGCKEVFERGEKNRITASTKMNEYSSRSHAILIVKIEKSYIISPDKIKELAKESNEKIMSERVMTKSTLFLVDLAGSERAKKTQANAMRLEEAKKINYSLLVLGNCIQSLTDPKSTHISYRDSKLTRLLQESLGGNAKTSLIVTISPALYNMDETNSTLMFGSRAMKVQNKPTINKTVDFQTLSIKLQEDLDKLNDEYLKLKIDYDQIISENNKFKNAENFLELSKFVEQQDTHHNKDEYAKLLREYEKTVLEKETFEKSLNHIDGIMYDMEIENDSLKKDIKVFKDNNDQLKSMINDLEAEKTAIQETVMELESKNEGLMRMNKDLMEKTGDSNLLKIEMNKLKEIIAVLDNDKECLLGENTQLNDKINHSKLIKDEMTSSLDVIKNDYQRTKDDNRIFKEKNKQLEQEKDELVKQYELIKFKNEELLRAKADIDTALEEIKLETPSNNPFSKNSSTTIDKVKSVMNIRKSSKKLDTHDNQLSNLQYLKNEYIRLKEDNETLLLKVKELELEVADKKDLIIKDSQIKTLEENIGKLKERVKSAKENKTELESTNGALQKKLNELTIKNDEIEIDRYKLKSNLEKVNNEYEISKKKLEVPKENSSTGTDNDLLQRSIIEIALDQKLISTHKDYINVYTLEKIIKNLRLENTHLQKEILNRNAEISNYITKELDLAKASEKLTKQIEETEKRAKLNERLKLDYQEKYEKLLEGFRKLESEKEECVKSIRILTVERDEFKKQNDSLVSSNGTISREYNFYKDTIKKQVEDLNSKLEDLEKLKINLEQKCIEYNDKLKELKKEKDDLHTNNKLLSIRVEELKRLNDDLLNKNTNLNKDNTTLKENNKNLTEEVKSIQYDFNTIKTDLEEKCIEYNDTIKTLRQSKETNLKTIKTLQTRIEDLRKVNDEASNNLKTLNKFNTKTNDEINFHKDQIEELNMRLADSDIQKQELQEKINKLRENIKTLQTEKEVLDSQIRVMDVTIDGLKEYNNNTLLNLENLSNEYNQLKQNINVAKKESENQTDNDLICENLIKLALDMKVILSADECVDYIILEKVIKLILIDKNELEDELARVNKSLSARVVDTSIKHNESEMKILNLKIKELESGVCDLEEAKKEIHRLNNQLERNSEDKIIVKCTIEALNNEIKKFQNEVDTYKAEINELNTSHKNLIEKIKTLEIEKTDFLKHIKNLKSELDNTNKFKTSVLKDLEELQNENQTLKTNLSISRKVSSAQTDNLSFPNKLLDIAIQSRTIGDKDTYLSPSLIDTMIINYFDKYNTINQNLIDKTEQCNKLFALQKANLKTIIDLENYKKSVNELTSKVKDYEKLKDELNNLRCGKTKEEAEQVEKIKGIEGELESNKKTLIQLNEETNKKDIIKNELEKKAKLKDTNTGVFLIKEYLSKTACFMEDLHRILLKKDE